MMDWEKLLNPKRLGHRAPKAERGRSPFHSDYDKLIFSDAFRRLARKTQVHPLANNDHIHNRLTHSLEVSCVGRSLGTLVGMTLEEAGLLGENLIAADIGDIVQCTCLAHDIGNPPFGHTGENAIRLWFAASKLALLDDLSAEERFDLSHFDGNAQGLRVLTSLENHMNEGGMRLTYATLASFIKYPWVASFARSERDDNKFGVFLSELSTFHEIANCIGLLPVVDGSFTRHPLVFLMEAADDFCYGVLDLEDGIEMGLLSWEELHDILAPVLPKPELGQLSMQFDGLSVGRKTALLRGKVIGHYIAAAAAAFTRHHESYLAGDATPLIDLCGEDIKYSLHGAKAVAKEKLYNHPRKMELEKDAYSVLGVLLDTLSGAVSEWMSHPGGLSERSQRLIDMIGEASLIRDSSDQKQGLSQAYLALRRVVDFISGMTDNYAIDVAKQFQTLE